VPREQVSAVIPTYNYGRFVVEAVESALGQSWPVEVIVVDDGSFDDTRQRLAGYGDRIRYIYQENRGLSAARNTGIRAARGEWVAFLDADDVWHRDKTAVQLNAAARAGEFDLVGSPGRTEPLPEQLPPDPPVRPLTVRDFLLSTPINASTAIVRRRCFDEVGFFDETLRSVEDRDMWLRLCAHYDALQVQSPCMTYRTHDQQMSRRASRMHEAYTAVLDKFFRDHPQGAYIERLGRAYMFVDSAVAHLDEGERQKALGYMLQSLRTWPLPLRTPAARTRLRRAKLLVRLCLGDGLLARLKGAR